MSGDRLGRMRQYTVQAAILLPLSIVLSSCANNSMPDDEAFYVASACGTNARAQDAWRPGCATRSNFVALAENATDLYLPREDEPRDAMRRDAVFSDYFQSRAKASTAVASAPVQSNQTAVKP